MNTTNEPDRFFAAGVELLLEDRFGLFDGGLTPDVVARRAQRSRRTFYDRFGSKSAYARALLSSDVVSALSDIDARTEEFRGLISSLDGDLVAVLRALGQLLYDDAVEVPRADLAMISFALGRGEASVHHTLRSQMIEGDEPVREFATSALRAWGMTLRPPWTPELFAVVLRALGHGLFIRAELGDENATAELMRLTVLTMAPAIMQNVDIGTESVDDVARRLAVDASRTWRENREPTLVANARARIGEVLAQQLEHHGYHHLDLGDIATASGISRATIRTAFGDVDELIIMVISDHLPLLAGEVELGLGDSDAASEVAERHVRRLVRIVDQNRAVFRALLAMAFGGADSAVPDALIAELAAPHGLDPDHLFDQTGGNPFFVTEVLGAGTGEIPPSV
ncbi:MAG: TetR/AcrR family transcriptional regulator, partial [Acidobacteria bacterium]|nr:TetR/AcrR family transcriptional regulator [Acidobacteriota bacterium]